MSKARAFAGWMPAIILPLATLDQLRTILFSGHIEGVSAITWFLFFLANAGALFIGRAETKLAMLQMGLAFGLTAVLDLVIVALVLLNDAQAG